MFEKFIQTWQKIKERFLKTKKTKQGLPSFSDVVKNPTLAPLYVEKRPKLCGAEAPDVGR